MKRAVSILLGIIMAITFLVGSLAFICQFEYFYAKEFEKLEVIDTIGIEIEARELAHVMVTYLKGNRDEFQITAKVKGEERELFNEKEQTHMHDIVGLIKAGNWVTLIGIGCIIVIYGICMIKKEREVLKRGYKTALFAYILLLLGLASSAIIDFNGAFTLFHQILFTNDLWLLDPNQDILLMLMPLEFFIDGLKLVLMLATGGIIIIGVMTWYILQKINSRVL